MPPKKAKANKKPRVALPPPHLRTEEQQYMYVHQFERNVTCTGVEHGSTLSLTPGSVAVARDVLFSQTGQQRKRLLWIGCAEGAEVRSMALQCPNVYIDAIDINENCIHINENVHGGTVKQDVDPVFFRKEPVAAHRCPVIAQMAVVLDQALVSQQE